MGKVSPKDGQCKIPKQKRQSKSTKSMYLRPGALAQLRYTKVSAAKCCTDLWKKKVVVRIADNANEEVVLPNNVNDESSMVLSPVRYCLGAVTSPMDLAKQNTLQMTPKTPGAVEGMSESRLESLPLDLLVKILCHLQHDQLKSVFHVSHKIRKAVILARQFHFNYTTPDRMRQDMLRTMTPLPVDHWPFASKGDGKSSWVHSPHTPQAPKHGARPPSRLKFTEMEQIAAVLFPESAFPSRCLVPSVIPKPLSKSLGSNRVLFYEDELCQAVSQNKLL
ncbi:F-box protein At4g35930 [Nicotiana tabacum]|uniref:F-box protein At4g35930 n=1 Tax=Nicotiana tabacum TaxID=4097 RepID=A0A1S4CHS6_TOBAC|nr:F-box protein At4g35930-like [Nicotiana tomentosiformis]XP_009611043.1 F-box protein At4g35930-like [Nicotiana tomentosiformis]XP_009611044.1 F-box protein At4g35930-like [Nicotiana tomentosiformis]XP_016500723.1 PREDICTED: F-box protein At4g35930-like [Nicotiana tabacum]XP_016500724.1 PREDICTED: F-box protein At4g35930-like [Nicotiana tabacum]XP_016500725.1 PREDICTED: F-box protein At4g35930-like [Nicotiana tabacum]